MLMCYIDDNEIVVWYLYDDARQIPDDWLRLIAPYGIVLN